MDTTTGLRFAIVALVCLSGCTSLTGSVAPPPGVDDETLTNRTALFDAHSDALLEEGFVFEIQVQNNATDTPNTTSTIHVAPHATRYRIVTRLENGTAIYELWGNQSRMFVRSRNATGEWSLIRSGGPLDLPSNATLTGVETFREWTSAMDPLVVKDTVQDDGRSLTVLVGSRPGQGELPPVQARLEADKEGRVWNGYYRESLPDDGGVVTQNVTFTISQLGNVSLGHPDWVGEPS